MACPSHHVSLPIYFMHDQPTTCAMRGQQTEWVGERPQLHACECGYRFFVEEECIRNDVSA